MTTIALLIIIMAQARLLWLYHARHKELADHIVQCDEITDEAMRAGLVEIVRTLGSAYRLRCKLPVYALTGVLLDLIRELKR